VTMISWHRIEIWSKALISPETLKAFLAALGVLWTLAEPTVFISSQFSQFVKDRYLWFVAAAVVYAIWDRRPRLKVSRRLNGLDVTINVAIGDVFDFDGALVIGTNTTFDTRIAHNLISEKSIQGHFTKLHYSDTDHLDREIHAALAEVTCETLNGQRVGKSRRYEIGTVVKVAPKGKTAYLVAIAHINEHGTASGNFEDLKDALAKLWAFMGERGGKEALVIPVLGTRFGRIDEKRENVTREIIKSFAAACADERKVFCEELTIVIAAKDAAKYSIDIDKLGAFLSHTCEYTEFSPKRAKLLQKGAAVGISAVRNEQILLPSPLQIIPQYDLLEGQFIVFPDSHRQSGEKFYIWRLNLTLYMIPQNDVQLVIPPHRCEGTFEIDGRAGKCFKETGFHAVFFPVYGSSWTNGVDGSGGVIDRPGRLHVQAEVALPPAEINEPGDVRIKIYLRPIDVDQPILIDEALHLVSPGGGELFRWVRVYHPTDKPR
jgi:antiphage defense system Thoeris ThsA-like protein